MAVLQLIGGLVLLLVGGVAYLVISSYLRRSQLEAYVKKHGLKLAPEVPEWKPVVGHVPVLTRYSPHNRLGPFTVEMSEKVGSTFRFEGPLGKQLIVTVDPEVVRHFISGDRFKQGVYAKGPFYKDQFQDLLGDGIFNSDGDAWKWHRNLATTLFHVQYLKTYVDTFDTGAKVLCDQLAKFVGNPAGVDIQNWYLRFTIDQFAVVGFGINLDSMLSEKNDFAEAIDYSQEFAHRRARLGPLWKVKEKLSHPKQYYDKIKVIDEFVFGYINRRRVDSEEVLQSKHDLLSRLLLLAKEDPDNFSDARLRDFTLNFLFAGRDTTASLLTMTTYNISKKPEIMQKIREEIDAVVGDGEITWKKMKDMTYLTMVLKETLRLYPPVPIDGYEALEDDVLPGNYYVPKGATVIYTQWAMHRRKDIFGEDADEYIPERWENPTKIPFSFLPFHGGPRQCLGQEMAYLEAKIALVNVLRRFDITVHPEYNFDTKASLILYALDGMRVQLTPRD